MNGPDDEAVVDRASGGITVTGAGAAASAVDQVKLILGIALVRPDAGAAFEAAAATATRVLAILADDGADSRSVRTADLTLGPVSEWRDNRDVVVGYQAGQRLTVLLAGLAGVERLLTDVAMGGGEGVRIENLTLTSSDPQAALARARDAAFADALAKATQLADLARRRLGRLQWLDERQHTGSTPMVLFGRQAYSSSTKMPVATGDVEVGVTLTASWVFAD